MNRRVISTLGVVILTGAFVSIASSQNADVERGNSLEGKAVIIQMERVHFGVKQDLRFETLGNRGFFVIPMQEQDGDHYDHWWPMDKVTGLKVFDSVKDAKAYDKKTFPSRERETSDTNEAK